MWNWLYGPLLLPKADRMGTYAAALAYCFVLSMVPFLAVAFTVGMRLSNEFGLGGFASHYSDVLSDIIPSVNPAVPSKIFDAVQKSYYAQGNLFTIGFVLAVYTSFNLMEQIIRTLLFIFDDPRRPQEWSMIIAVKTLALLLIWMLLLLLISMSAVEASVLQHLLDHSLFSNVTQALVTGLQVLVVIFALFCTLFLTYSLVPSKRYRTNSVVEGSLLAACGWIASSLLFASVMPKLLQTSAAYLALGSIVAILLWAQACAWSIIAGACWIVRFTPKGR